MRTCPSLAILALIFPFSGAIADDVSFGFATSCPDAGTPMPSVQAAFDYAETHPGTTLNLPADSLNIVAGEIEDAVDFTMRSASLTSSCVPEVSDRVAVFNLSTEATALSIRGGNATIERLQFARNPSEDGEGAVFIRGASVVIRNAEFLANNRTRPSDFERSGGGAINLASAAGNPAHLVLENTFFDRNSTNGSGGAIFCNGGRATAKASTISLAGADVFADNSAGSHGGAIYLLQNCEVLTAPGASPNFGRNLAGRDGGAIAIAGDTGDPGRSPATQIVAVASATFGGNEAGRNGGAISARDRASVTIDDSAFSGNIAVARGGAISIDGSLFSLSASTLQTNQAAAGGAIALTRDPLLFPNALRATIAGRCDSRRLPRDTYCAEFRDNTVSSGGGAIFSTGYGLSIRGYAFIGNAGTSAAVLHNTLDEGATGQSLDIENALFAENSIAPIFMGAITRSPELALRHVTIAPITAAPTNPVVVIESDSPPSTTYLGNIVPASSMFGHACSTAFESARFVEPRFGAFRLRTDSPGVDPTCATADFERDLPGERRTAPADHGAFESMPLPDPLFRNSFE